MEFRDLKSQYKHYKNEIDIAINKVLNDANFINGNEVKILESKLAEYVGVKNCVTCGNGTDALLLVLMAWGIKKGDAVFVPDFTFFATAEVVSLLGATPIFVNVDFDTYNMNYLDLERRIKSVIKEKKYKPKVIIPVDLFGLPANYKEIKKISKVYNLKILEDGAQGFGGSINNEMACSFGHASTTSFFPAKPLGCYGDGGAIFTDNDDLANLIRSYAVHGKGINKYDNVRVGINSRLDTIQAAILNVKFDFFKKYELDKMKLNFEKYNNFLMNYVITPIIPEGYRSGFAQYTIRLKSRNERDYLKSKLMDYDIPTMVYYAKPLHKQKAFEEILDNNEDFYSTDEICDTVLSLPFHPYMNEDEIKFISAKIVNILREY